jgi:U4/U6.U5 tri-snRNP-associated protein 1
VAARRDESEGADVKLERTDDGDEDSNGLVFDDTSEFVRNISYNPAAVKAEPTEPRLPEPAAQTESTTADVAMADGDQAVTELAAGDAVVKEEDEEEDDAMLNALEDAMKRADDEAVGQPDGLGTAGEQMFGTGLASTLNILRQQGLVAGGSADSGEREQIQIQRDLWLATQRRRVAERELERVRARGQNKDQATREYENRVREQQEARETLETFRDYKPDVQIVYYDEHGRSLTPKEAWKALSHKFHGKGSGRMKQEKQLKKIAEEKKKEAMASGDTPLSMQQAFQIRQERAGQAHMVLSVGNRGYVVRCCSQQHLC